MPHYHYLIVGGGMTADAAIRGIREADSYGSIGLVGAEIDRPYNRPPLSKGLWKGKAIDSIWRGTDATDAALHLGRTVVHLDPPNRKVIDDQGAEYTYDQLLLATGGTPRRLPFGADHILYFRTLQDYLALRGLTERGRRFAVIGGGFIGSEIAAALAMNGKEVVLFLAGENIGEGIFPPELARFVTDYYRQRGVEVLADSTVTGLETDGQRCMLRTQNGQTVAVEGVVAGIGIEPNTRLAEAVGLKVDDGILVDESLRTSAPEIYAAGDVARFYNPDLDKYLRVEHEDNANTMGRAAGRAMAGASDPYHHLPFFYSDLFDLGYEAVGELDPSLELMADWQEQPYRKGVVYYLREGRVRGVLLWNLWEQVDAARALIRGPGLFRAGDLMGRLAT
ncbi:MAG: FAD-dependent oxidoreductase [Pseudomonadota bacterium]|nr:FAD-dependent oxidoreductase [Gammaproteobacteria bacterium]MDQ3582351.1 FAD-dependent oxidoreductase [Pseudomonadota bacterium]